MAGTIHTGLPGAQPADGHFTAAILQATLSANRITSIVALAFDAPQLWAFSVTLGLGEDPGKVERLADALALAAGADSCRVARSGGRMLLEIPKPVQNRKPLKAARLDGLQAPTPAAVPLGISTAGGMAWLDIADDRTAHVIIGGTTGSGKTCGLHWLLYRLIRQNAPAALRMLAFDPKQRELAPFASIPHLLHPIVSNSLETARVLSWVAGELGERMASGRITPRLLVVVEEVADLVATNQDVSPLLARIAQVGRGLGVHLIATTQQPGAKSLGDALANFPCRLLGRVASATLTFGAAGRARTGANDLLGRGDFLLIVGGDVTRVQLPLVDGRQLGALPRTAQPASLNEELPALAMFADRARDSRGGAGRRELREADYEAIGQALQDGATVADLRQRFGIGYDRAARLYARYRGDR